MRITVVAALVAAALSLGACAELQKAQQIYTVATTATVPAEVVRPAANAFDILKGTAANFASYCIQSQMQAAGCDVDTRRRISIFVKQGTKARAAVRGALANNQPVLSTVYNVLVDAVTGLQSTPVSTFTGN